MITYLNWLGYILTQIIFKWHFLIRSDMFTLIIGGKWSLILTQKSMMTLNYFTKCITYYVATWSFSPSLGNHQTSDQTNNAFSNSHQIFKNQLRHGCWIKFNLVQTNQRVFNWDNIVKYIILIWILTWIFVNLWDHRHLNELFLVWKDYKSRTHFVKLS